jgi:hypothetical protein
MKRNGETLGEIIRYLKGKTSRKEAAEFKKKLKEDAQLAKDYALLKKVASQFDLSPEKAMLAAVERLADRLVRDFQTGKRHKGEPYGVTVFDSKLLPLPEGVRPAVVDTRKLKYRIGDCTLDIALYPVSPDSYELIGQIVGCAEEDRFQVILKAKKDKYSTDTDQFHLFRFERVFSGKYRLSVRRGRETIAIVELEL